MFRIEELTKRLLEYKEIKEVLYWQKDMRDNIRKFMNNALDKCHTVLLFCSENSYDSKGVSDEWTAADMLDKPIIPVYLELDHIPPLLRSRLAVEFSLVDFEKNVVDLFNLIIKKCRG